jgi:cell division protein FtsN
MLGLVYRVFVPAADATTQAQIRAIVGDAFRVNLNGQTMMQVGAYADQATAEAKAAEMVAQGFEARIEHNP